MFEAEKTKKTTYIAITVLVLILVVGVILWLVDAKKEDKGNGRANQDGKTENVEMDYSDPENILTPEIPDLETGAPNKDPEVGDTTPETQSVEVILAPELPEEMEAAPQQPEEKKPASGTQSPDDILTLDVPTDF